MQGSHTLSSWLVKCYLTEIERRGWSEVGKPMSLIPRIARIRTVTTQISKMQSKVKSPDAGSCTLLLQA